MKAEDAAGRNLLAAVREHGVKPPGSVAMVIIARAQLLADGKNASVPALVDLTGYARSGIYRARKWLDENVPEWEYAGVTPSARPASSAPVTQRTGRSLVPTAVVAPPPWRVALVERRAAVEGRRSWDLYGDIYSPAADQLFAVGQIDDLIALTIHYVDQVHGRDLTGPERGRIAKLVRSFGKAALYGLKEAMNRVDDDDVPNLLRYATAVAQSAQAKAARASTNGAH